MAGGRAMGLSGGQDLHACPVPTFRGRPRAHAWPKPCLTATTYTLAQLPRFDTDDERTLREALFGRKDLHADALRHRFRRRSPTHAWAKPCLAGRPMALVRTQPPEQHTSRGRPSGMELPDYPVMATLPTPQDQDGPALPLPAGSFPVLVPRSASRRVFSSFSCFFSSCLRGGKRVLLNPHGYAESVEAQADAAFDSAQRCGELGSDFGMAQAGEVGELDHLFLIGR
jgi:hypothetical protein